MTLYHAINVIALAVLPIYFTYKFSVNLSEYGGIMRCIQAGGFYYIYTQILKMLLLTFFPSSEVAVISGIAELVSSLIDCLGLLYALRKVSGKGHMKILQIAIGWCASETIFTRGLSLWRAKGVEFEWTYTQKALESNISFVETLILVCLIWALDRNDLNRKYIFQIWALVILMIAGPILIPTAANEWNKLLIKSAFTVGVGIPSLYVYSSMPNKNY